MRDEGGEWRDEGGELRVESGGWRVEGNERLKKMNVLYPIPNVREKMRTQM